MLKVTRGSQYSKLKINPVFFYKRCSIKAFQHSKTCTCTNMFYIFVEENGLTIKIFEIEFHHCTCELPKTLNWSLTSLFITLWFQSHYWSFFIFQCFFGARIEWISIWIKWQQVNLLKKHCNLNLFMLKMMMSIPT